MYYDISDWDECIQIKGFVKIGNNDITLIICLTDSTYE